MNPTLPNFLGLGAQKSGTTWLHEMLKQHPDIYLPEARKELMYFDVENNYNNENYSSFFTNATGKRIVGEITAGYLWTSGYKNNLYQIDEFRQSIPSRVKSVLGENIRFVVLLRHPVKRAVSAYLHHHYNGALSGRSFKDCWQGDGIVHMGFYSRHLDAWLTEFEREKFHIRTYEQVVKDKQAYLDSLCRFFNIDTFKPDRSEKKYQAKYNYNIQDSGVYIESPDGPQKMIDINDLNELAEIYAEDIERLKREYGVDVSHWGE